jgi:hypothetical protein
MPECARIVFDAKQGNRSSPPEKTAQNAIVWPHGSREALKWLALFLMTGDHVNKYLFNGALPIFFEAGRLALPIFVTVLAYNLARFGTTSNGVYERTMKRLLIAGMVATLPFIALGNLRGGWWPLNVMFTLLVVTLCAFLLGKSLRAADSERWYLFISAGTVF